MLIRGHSLHNAAHINKRSHQTPKSETLHTSNNQVHKTHATQHTHTSTKRIQHTTDTDTHIHQPCPKTKRASNKQVPINNHITRQSNTTPTRQTSSTQHNHQMTTYNTHTQSSNKRAHHQPPNPLQRAHTHTRTNTTASNNQVQSNRTSNKQDEHNTDAKHACSQAHIKLSPTECKYHARPKQHARTQTSDNLGNH